MQYRWLNYSAEPAAFLPVSPRSVRRRNGEAIGERAARYRRGDAPGTDRRPGDVRDATAATAQLDDHTAMGLALALADEAAKAGEVPVGAVVLHAGEVVGRGRNRREADQDPSAHAELLALREAAATLGTWRLEACTLVVTLEPCPMCAGAAWAARVGRLVFGAPDPSAGAVGSLYNLAVDTRLNHQSEVRHGVRAEESRSRLDTFFAERRPGGPA